MSGEFDRFARVVGGKALDRLRGAHVALLGVGGVGGFAAEALARSGVGHITIVDGDSVALSNINRQIIALHSTLGMSKVDAARARILDISPDTEVTAVKRMYMPGEPLPFDLPVDFVIDAIDMVAAKVELACRCEEMGIPLISCMGTGNKLDPSLLRVADIYSTDVCPLCRVMRRELRKRGVGSLRVVFSPEEPLRPIEDGEQPQGARRSVPGSTMFVPPVAGIMLAREAVMSIIGDALTERRA
ncbi:MAG: tRNA threonylcarbamoyladenosine dehydratase [Candidatus Fimadaptatus sp.]|jgi:tRNA A37 threonylcarbamoyladenosine dehydratase